LFCIGLDLMRLCVIFATEGGLNSEKLCVYSEKLCGKKCLGCEMNCSKNLLVPCYSMELIQNSRFL
jgi:hypothetical protein